MKKYNFLFFTLLLAFLFIPKDAFALTISNVEFLDNSNNITATYTKSDIDNGIIGKDEPFLATKMRFNFTNSGLKSSTDYNFTSNFDLAGNRVFDTIFTSRLYSGSSQQTQSYKWMLLSTEVVNPIYNANYSFNTNWTNNNSSQDLKIEFDLGGEIIVYSFRLNQAKLLSEGENVGDSINNQTQELLDNQNKNQQQTNERLDELIGKFKSCKVSDNLFKYWDIGGINGETGIVVPTDTRLRTSYFINVYNDDYFFTLGNSSFKFVAIYMYGSNNDFIGYYNGFSNNDSFNYKFADNVKKVKVVIGKEDNSTIALGDLSNAQPKMQRGKDGVYCTNKIDETNEKLDKLEQSITNEDGPSLDAIEDSSGWLPPGPVDSILNLPLTFLNNLISNLSKTCAPVSIPIPFVNQSFQLPCISTLYDSMGITTFVNWVGLISGTLILYYYLLSLYKWVDNTIQMKDNNDWGGV